MRVLFHYFILLYQRHRIQLSLGILLAISTLFASIGLLMLSSWFLASTATVGVFGLYTFNYMLPAAGVRGAAITRTISRWAERVVNHDATFRVLQNLRCYIFTYILFSPGTIVSLERGKVLNRLVADINTLEHLYLRVISPFIVAMVVTLTVSTSLCLLYRQAGLLLSIIILAILVLFPPLFYIISKPVGEALTTLRSDYRLKLTTWLSNNAELTLYGAEKYYRYRLDITEQRWQVQQCRQNCLSASIKSLLILVTGLTLTLMLWLVSGNLGSDGLSGPLVALFAFATLAVFEALSPLAGAFQYLGQVIACAIRLNSIIQQPKEVTFPENGAMLPATSVSIKINRIRFCYPKQTSPAINELTLQVSAGEHIAFLGHTGSGKSTLIKLLTRAWDPQKGEIKFNNILLREWSESALRSMTTVVEQRIHIFSATLRDNLLLAAPNADDNQLKVAIQQVGLDKLLRHKGLNTWVGEGGHTLSGGEQRRIGIARALLHDAPLWLLDEPTDGLDSVNEKQILQLLSKLKKRRTVILITHRLLGLEHFDRIYILDRGALIEQGNHQMLMALRGRYYHYHYSVERYINE
ncbi:putative multidrug resistance ABC transporter ATP-binding/permease protein YheH [Candidatus Gullanella endobia]|uniref:Putative multidrug resistance ABC transporter ATP-binding/permease protein YheH n=1 Tax=Candidatus Gullanella endobia TaxID=1070130 RepID=A0A143WRQ0_9ENTR|nr:cysteine/glutathione ABC transporter ATP-binding protein/permease CydC [Candidatus Gullanella endobia]CUX96281.1 putative multidrug resistance ABC transporter ATP-binding/permease protein YheH [Candidatus Gullanella endobia]